MTAPRRTPGPSQATPTTADPDRLARQIAGGPSRVLLESFGLGIRQGQVTTFNIASQTCSITLGGGDVVIPGVAHASNYRPGIGDVVWVLTIGNDLLVYDRVGAFGPSLFSTAASAFVTSAQTRSSTSYGDLSTVGPQVTTTISPSGLAIVHVSAWIENQVAGEGGKMAFVMSGANTRGTFDVEAQVHFSNTIFGVNSASKVTLCAGLNSGVTTVTCKYASVIGDDVEFATRFLWVLPL